ncbi:MULTISPECIES: NosR/NirI family protein [unclassified Marinobacter]|jgi:NosR/NirI family nitrous oxide reductase transcriptional regulator|uniref:NosR/NirI family protein n=1 Tax=unclassified Marinobacter TaxID=83889 RepID=UPI000C89EC37|nr:MULTISPECIES: NosR/NirI family protein [unclassified Marinobacter]MAB53233.1 ferredoxin [Marinobacter sp.]|tara:strand:- start:3943 stop:6045 length:2103 start_codon:yes stop_codon:yes gene_type:complete
MPLRLLLLLVLACFPLATYGALDDEKQALIQELFPKATDIRDRLPDYPVYPVYQLQELIGYAYESRDISPLQGFAGKPVSMLIGLDSRGRFTGIRILNHHEPVFLHGLGEEPLFEFIDQYEGRSLTEQIIIDTSGSRSGKSPDGNVVHFDGVSKATVSVLIINDTVLSSALKVARKKLAGFTQEAPTRAKTDLYQPLSWAQLIERGYIGHWRISSAAIEQKLGSPLVDYPEASQPDPGEPFAELFFGYINAPMVGRNLLGDEGFQRLKEKTGPDAQILAVMSRGLYPHLPDDFTPGSSPDRLGLQQNSLSLDIRDINVFDQNIQINADGMPEFARTTLFRVGGNAGFNPGAEATLKLGVTLRKNHLVADSTELEIPMAFAQELFEAVEVTPRPEDNRQPVWIGLWKERWLTISLLVLSLTLLTVFFARQRTLSQYPKLVHRFRWGFLLFTLFFIGFYAQGQLSVVNIYTLFLAIWDGFSLNVFLMDPVLFILWTYTFISLFVWGRGLFCGWLCPFGALQEMAAWLGEKLKFRQVKVPEKWHRRLILLKYPILLVLVGTAFYSLELAEKLVEVEPFKTGITLFFVRYWPFVAYAVGLLVVGMFIHKFYCRYLCPLGAGLAVLGKLRLFSWLDRVELCGKPCQHCKNSCGINAIHKDGRIDYNECIQCLECVVILKDQSQCVDKVLEKKRQRQAQILATDAG